MDDDAIVSRQSQDQAARQDQEAILCGICSRVITHHSARVSRGGRHHHAFFNPAGITFEISCYATAPGCLIQGKATDAFTWFAGYRWQYALCRTCYLHLGWRFTSTDDTFFGLIDGRLVG